MLHKKVDQKDCQIHPQAKIIITYYLAMVMARCCVIMLGLIFFLWQDAVLWFSSSYLLLLLTTAVAALCVIGTKCPNCGQRLLKDQVFRLSAERQSNSILLDSPPRGHSIMPVLGIIKSSIQCHACSAHYTLISRPAKQTRPQLSVKASELAQPSMPESNQAQSAQCPHHQAH